jgi:hypothetical protein
VENLGYYGMIIGDFYGSPNIIRVMKLGMLHWVGHVARMVETLKAYNITVKKLLGKQRRNW